MKDNRKAKHEHVLTCIRLGMQKVEAQDGKGAYEAYMEGMRLSLELIGAEPDNAGYLNTNGLLSIKIGELLVLLRKQELAEEPFRFGLIRQKEALKLEPNNLDFKRNLALSYYKTGNYFLATNQKDMAMQCFLLCVTMREELAHTDPSNAMYLIDLAQAHGKLAENGNQIRPRYERALALMEKARLIAPLNKHQLAIIADIQQRLRTTD